MKNIFSILGGWFFLGGAPHWNNVKFFKLNGISQVSPGKSQEVPGINQVYVLKNLTFPQFFCHFYANKSIYRKTLSLCESTTKNEELNIFVSSYSDGKGPFQGKINLTKKWGTWNMPGDTPDIPCDTWNITDTDPGISQVIPGIFQVSPGICGSP